MGIGETASSRSWLAALHDAAAIERGIASFAQNPNGGLMTLPHALTNVNASMIIALAQRHRLPATYAVPEHAAAEFVTRSANTAARVGGGLSDGTLQGRPAPQPEQYRK